MTYPDPFYKGVVFEQPCFLWNIKKANEVKLYIGETPPSLFDRLQPYTRCSILTGKHTSSASARIGSHFSLALSKNSTQTAFAEAAPSQPVSYSLQLKTADDANLHIAPLCVRSEFQTQRQHPINDDETNSSPEISEAEKLTMASRDDRYENYFTQTQAMIKERFLKALDIMHDNEKQFLQTQRRFQYYLQEQITDRHIVSLPQCLDLDCFNILATVPNRDVVVREVQQTFEIAARRCILDYALLNADVCRRLKLDELNAIFAFWNAERCLKRSPLFVQIPEEWVSNHKRNAKALGKWLQRYRPSLIALRMLWWGQYQKRTLLQNVESIQELFPIEFDTYKKIQLQYSDQRKAHLLSSWIPKAIDTIVEIEHKETIESHQFHKGLDALQYIQLKSLLHASCHAMIDSLLTGAPTEEKTNTTSPVFLLKIVMNNRRAHLSPTKQQITEILHSLLDKCSAIINEVPTFSSELKQAKQLMEEETRDTGCDYVLKQTKQKIEEILDDGMRVPLEVCDALQEHIQEITDPEIRSDLKIAAELSLSDVTAKLAQLQEHRILFEEKCRELTSTNLFMISTAEIEVHVQKTIVEIRSLCIESVKSAMEENCDALMEAFEEKAYGIEKESKTLAAAVAIKSSIESIKQFIHAQSPSIAKIKEQQRFLVHHRCMIPAWIFDNVVQVQHWPKRLTAMLAAAANRAEMFINNAQRLLLERISSLKQRLFEMPAIVNEMVHEGSTKRKERFRQRLLKLTESVMEFVEEGKQVNENEELLEWNVTDFSMFQELQKRLNSIP